MSELSQVGVRELRQNLSVYLERVAAGETLEVTDRGHAVAVLAPVRASESAIDRLRRMGQIVPATADLLAATGRTRTKDRRWASRQLQRDRQDRRL